MVAMVQRLNARSFCHNPQLIVLMFLAFFLKVHWNRLRCHGCSVTELAPPKLSNFGHSVPDSWPAQTSHGCFRRHERSGGGSVDFQNNPKEISNSVQAAPTDPPLSGVTRRRGSRSAFVQLCDHGHQLACQTIFGYESVYPLQGLLRNIHCCR
jgi:hypothetical protein